MKRRSRRDFLRLTAAGLGMLAQGYMATACGQPSPPKVTAAPLAPAVPTATQAVAETPPAASIRRPDIIKFYPDMPSAVIRTRHAGVWEGEKLRPQALRQMLDASITRLTGLDDPQKAWAALFAPDERIALKVSAIGGRGDLRRYAHLPLISAVVECLQDAGVPAEQIFIYDRYTYELKEAGFPVNEGESGVRCYGTAASGPILRDSSHAAENYVQGFRVLDVDLGLSEILMQCDALINLPVLSAGALLGMGTAGISFAMKNHFGTFNCPTDLHADKLVKGVAELNALPPIKDRTRLIIGDILTANTYGTYGRYVIGDSTILMSYDPVAVDTIGTRISAEAFTAMGLEPKSITSRAAPWLRNSAELGLGADNLANIELKEVNLE